MLSDIPVHTKTYPVASCTPSEGHRHYATTTHPQNSLYEFIKVLDFAVAQQIGLKHICISISHFHNFLKAIGLIILIFFLTTLTSTCLHLFVMFRIMGGGGEAGYHL